jgi:hypothetical protein
LLQELKSHFQSFAAFNIREEAHSSEAPTKKRKLIEKRECDERQSINAGSTSIMISQPGEHYTTRLIGTIDGFRRTFGPQTNEEPFPEELILDSTLPDQSVDLTNLIPSSSDDQNTSGTSSTSGSQVQCSSVDGSEISRSLKGVKSNTDVGDED